MSPPLKFKFHRRFISHVTQQAARIVRYSHSAFPYVPELGVRVSGRAPLSDYLHGSKDRRVACCAMRQLERLDAVRGKCIYSPVFVTSSNLRGVIDMTPLPKTWFCISFPPMSISL